MTQGSTTLAHQQSNVVDLAQRRKTELYQAVKEKESLCKAIEKIAMVCQDEGHASLDDVETIQYLARQLGQKLHTLADEIAGS
ncbi:hypothetical protein IDZ74_29400 [Pseudomonas aeruginosa]|uniref:hypothetical protein n=1 Tax=Pseudomonas aeruginosa TaxID=287 RepID=UPI001ADCE848|nr:hypothetical protein [Pseudomonas aeruginosa]MBO8406763.1 hypothetical protein [Pseudomonas aeruginosa]